MEVDNLENQKSMMEPIIYKDIIQGSYEIGILNKNGEVELSKMTFDKIQKLILITTKEGFEIKILFDDIISFIKDESDKIKKNQEENAELNNCKISLNLVRYEDIRFILFP